MRSLLCAVVALLLVHTGSAESPKLAEATNLGSVINSKADDVDPYLDPTGRLIVFSSNRNGTFDIYYAFNRDGKFSALKVLSGLGEQEADERSPSVFYKSGQKPQIYFSSNKVRDEKFKDLKNFDIKFRVGKRAPLDLVALSQREDEMHPCIAVGGREFYFSRKTKEGWKLFVAKGPAFGPVGGGKEVGFPAGFCHATLTKSGTRMFLQGKMKDGRTGIYASKRSDGKWSEPKLITNLVHPEAKLGAMTPCLSASGRSLFFASDRPGGRGKLDLWMVSTSDLTTADD